MERPLESVEDLEGMEKLMERSLESVEDLEGVKGPAEGSEASLLLAPAGAALLGLEELELPCEAAAAALGGGLRVKGPAEGSEAALTTTCSPHYASGMRRPSLPLCNLLPQERLPKTCTGTA